MPASDSETKQDIDLKLDQAKASDAGFGRLLKFWRSVNELSQAQLSEELETSPRHISFLETGRSKPSRAMVKRLQKVLQLKPREANILMLSAGFMPEQSFDSSTNAISERLRLQLAKILAKHEPYPAFVANDIGDVLVCNHAWINLISQAGLDLEGARGNIFHLLFSDEGLRSLISDWEDFSCGLLLQLKEQQLLTDDTRLNELMEWMEAYPGVPDDWPQRGRQVRFDSSYDITLNMPAQSFQMQTIVTGISPMNLAVTSQLKLHAFYPGDTGTLNWWQRVADKAQARGKDDESSQHPLLYLAPVL